MARRYHDFGTAMLAYRSRPEGEPIPVKTNWTVVAANDNADPEETADFSFERNLLVTPSVQEIMRQAKTCQPERNDAGQVVKIGSLRFSDGTQTERAFAVGADGNIVQFDARMPVGAMLGTVEKAKEQSGGKGYTEAQLEQSNLYFARMLGTIEPRYVKRSKRKNGRSISSQEAQAILDEAIANTKIMPKVKKYRPGLPCGGKRIADSFLGMQKGRKGESGMLMWQDMCSAIVDREIWEETLAQLSERDIATLDKAMEAETLSDIEPGGHKRTEERRGKRMLIAANDNLAIALRKSAA